MGASFSDIETRLENLENLVNSLSASITNNKFYTDADIAGCRNTEETNTVGVSDNDIAICDVADLADTNSMAIDDLAEMVDDLSNRVAELEG